MNHVSKQTSQAVVATFCEKPLLIGQFSKTPFSHKELHRAAYKMAAAKVNGSYRNTKEKKPQAENMNRRKNKQKNKSTSDLKMYGINKSGSKLRINHSEKLHPGYCGRPSGFLSVRSSFLARLIWQRVQRLWFSKNRCCRNESFIFIRILNMVILHLLWVEHTMQRFLRTRQWGHYTITIMSHS